MGASAAAVYTGTPRFTIDGREDPGLAQALLTLTVEEAFEGLYRCEASFTNWGPANGGIGYLYSDRKALDFGKPLKVEAGNGDRDGVLFDGRIMALEGRFLRQAPELLVLAEDRLQDLRMTRRTRGFENVSDEDIFREIASGHGLQTDLDLNGPTYRAIAQLNQSDLAFLRERARAIDADVWIEGSKLFAKARSRHGGATVKLGYLREVLECSILADLARQCTALRVTGWDVAAKSAIDFKADSSAVSNELDSLIGGSSILNSAIGDRMQQIVHHFPVAQDEAQSLAEAAYRRAARQFLTGTLITEGDGRMRVGSLIDLSGFSSLFDGKYFVTRVRHTYTRANGFRTHLHFERPGLGQAQ
jgi:phage protein D